MTRDQIDQLPEMLRPGSVCELLNIDPRTLDNLVAVGSIHPIVIRGMSERRFRKTDILELMTGKVTR